MVTFCSIAGVEPGVTTLEEVSKRFGKPESETTTQPYEVAGGDPGGDLIWSYETLGIRVFIDRNDRESENPFVDEIHVFAPFSHLLPCGLHIGQSIESARCVIAQNYRITDEYDDAIYFQPKADDRLLASVEWLDTKQVVSIELMRSGNSAT